MHDIRFIRAEPEAFDAALARRRLPPPAGDILGLDRVRRDHLTRLQETQARRNALSKQVGHLRRQGTDTAPLEAESAQLALEMAADCARDILKKHGFRKGK